MIKKIIYEKIISMELLTMALAKTKSNVTPGVDGITKADFSENNLAIPYYLRGSDAIDMEINHLKIVNI